MDPYETNQSDKVSYILFYLYRANLTAPEGYRTTFEAMEHSAIV